MTTKQEAAASASEAKNLKDEAKAGRPDPVGKAVAPVPVEVVDIPANEPYPTGDPKGPQTWAEINGLVPLGTGPLAPAGG